MCQIWPQLYCKERKRGGMFWSRGLNALFYRQVGCAYKGTELSFQNLYIFFKSLTLSADTGNIYLVFEGSYSVLLKVSWTSLSFCIPFFDLFYCFCFALVDGWTRLSFGPCVFSVLHMDVVNVFSWLQPSARISLQRVPRLFIQPRSTQMMQVEC